jgi:hypothetical protein
MFVCLALLACKGKEPSPPSPTKLAETQVTAAKEPAATPAVDKATPALNLTPVEPAKEAEAAEFNTKGLAALRGRDFPGAIATFKDALIANPGNIMARYNLACAHILSGARAPALAILVEFKSAQCAECLGRLRRAAEDPDWSSACTPTPWSPRTTATASNASAATALAHLSPTAACA